MTAADVVTENLELPPLRSLDDFVLGSARFQIPNIKDFDKWGNRVVKNLLYYQTNYFLLFLAIYGLMMIINPVKIICGLTVQAMIIAIILHFFGGGSQTRFLRIRVPSGGSDTQKWYILGGALLVGYLLLYWFDAILLSCFTLLLPFSLTFIHSSLRLRNLKNKVANTVASVNMGPSTPMGVFLDAFNIAADRVLS
ncbi:PRA1 family protein 3 [Stomoxys calcitrans]|uniref:PRA1 family protein n=1 Tax=Stomoxys calcitrans TaxID=35570 RepID=A0A1I8P8V1_STOCA|nr:PRA1 family protein 3 [Stomoxys calcitrans]